MLLSYSNINAQMEYEYFIADGISYRIWSDWMIENRSKDPNIAWVCKPNQEDKENTNTGEIIIPETVEHKGKNYTVTEIGDWAFHDTEITSISIPKTISSINTDAFRNCHITELIIPNTVTKISKGAFGESTITNLYIQGNYAEFSMLYGLMHNSTVTVHSKYITLAKKYFSGTINGTEKYWIEEQGETLLGSVSFTLKTLNPLEGVASPGLDTKPSYNTTRSSSVGKIQLKVNGKEYSGTVSTTFTILDLFPATKYDVYITYEENSGTTTLKDSIRTATPTYTLKYFGNTSGSVTFYKITASEDKSLTPTEVGVYCAETNGYYKADDKRYATINNLTPSSTYKISPYAIYKGKKQTGNSGWTVHTNAPELSASVSCNQTNLKIFSFKFLEDNTTEKPVRLGVRMAYGKEDYVYEGKTITFENLSPKTTYKLEFYAEYANGAIASKYQEYTTAGTNPSYGVKEKTATTIKLRAWCKIGTLHLEKAYIQGHPETTITDFPKGGEALITMYHLSPDTGYKPIFIVETKEGSKETYQLSKTISTEKLTLKTLPAKVIGNKSAIVCAETNIDNEETNVGFEWRKTDAPDVVVSKSASGTLYDGTLEGRISNLNTDSYYKVRAYYEDYNGKKYYGDWTGFDPSDFSYFEPTVHTYAKIDVQANTAKVRGVALQGTDDIIEQGFEYWAEAAAKTRVGENVMKVQATGQSMEADLTDLAYNTIYNYRAYVKTASGTTYGETQQFTTPADEATGINNVNGNTSGELNFAIRQEGNLQISISGNNEECSYNIVNISGNQVFHGKAVANSDWQTITDYRLPSGLYIISVNNGNQKKAKKIAIK